MTCLNVLYFSRGDSKGVDNKLTPPGGKGQRLLYVYGGSKENVIKPLNPIYSVWKGLKSLKTSIELPTKTGPWKTHSTGISPI